MKKTICTALMAAQSVLFVADSVADLLISEVLYDAPNSDSTEEWIEIFNNSCNSIDLSNYKLTDNSGTFLLNGTLPAEQYYIVARNTSGFSSLYGVSPDLPGMNLALGNSGDTVTLFSGSTQVDKVSWENHSAGWSVSAKDTTIARQQGITPDTPDEWFNTQSLGTPGTGSLSADCSGSGGGGSTTPGQLSNGTPVGNLSDTKGNDQFYSVNIPSGASDLVVQLSGGTGDADLYVRYGAQPTQSTYDCRPYVGGNNETCTISSPQSGTYHILLNAYSNYSGASLVASFTTGSGGGTGSTYEDFETYYADAIGKTGPALRSALNESARKGHNRMTYSQVWDALKYTDEDPANSNNVILLYTGRSQSKSYTSSSSSDPDAWNREHSWPKSLGFPSSGQWGYTDIHHLRPTDASVNSTRGNLDYGNASSKQVSEAPGTYYDSTRFNPRDAVKGDVARMMFYMDVRYDGDSTSNMPDLTLVNDTSSSSGTPKLGVLCTLVQWHRDDAVDSWEIRRHNRVFERQGNRNPFIDNPNWVEDIYGAQCN